jgi:hypothetical protein
MLTAPLFSALRTTLYGVRLEAPMNWLSKTDEKLHGSQERNKYKMAGWKSKLATQPLLNSHQLKLYGEPSEWRL